MKITLEEYTNQLNIGKYAGICYGKNNIDQNKQDKNNQDEKTFFTTSFLLYFF